MKLILATFAALLAIGGLDDGPSALRAMGLTPIEEQLP